MPTQVKITFESKSTRPDIKIIRLEGEIDESNLGQLQEKVDPLVDDEGVKTVVFNFSKLEFINSKVIGYLASLYSRLAEKGKKLVFAESSDNIKDILSLVGLTTIVDYYESMEEAMKKI